MLPVAAVVLYSLLAQDSVAFRVHAPTSVHAGEPVPIELVLTNRTERRLTLYLQGRPLAFDVTISREDGTVVWRRLEGQVVSAILAVRELAPAESLTFEAVWDGRQADGRPSPPGRYLIAGNLRTDTPEGLTTLPVPLQIIAVHAE
jgi:intracellular proteinase inhibitor BsuPI